MRAFVCYLTNIPFGCIIDIRNTDSLYPRDSPEEKALKQGVIMSAVLKILAVVAGTVLVLVVWYQASGVIVTLMDWNLQFIKWACRLLPAPYGSMAEAALRGALGADKALLFAEGTWLVGGLFRALVRPLRSNNPKTRLRLAR